MALRWDITNVEDSENICWVEADKDYPAFDMVKGEKYMNPVTNAIIWKTMAVGIGKITEANAADFWARTMILDMLYGIGTKDCITAEEVRQHIGLTTNVVNETKAAWLKRTCTREYDDLISQYKRNIRSGVEVEQ